MVSKGTNKYREFYSKYKRVKDLGQRQLDLLEELGRELLMPYPTKNPIPPATRRGRPPNPPKQ
jgi:hypothetical protein